MHDAFKCLGEVYFALCSAVDSPVSLGMWMRFKYKEYLDLVSKSVKPLDYDSRLSFEKDYFITEYLSKYRGEGTGVDLEEEGLRRFKTAEEFTKQTNARLRASRSAAVAADVASVLYRAQRNVARILGALPGYDVFRLSRWSPGATATISRRRARVDNKMLSLPFSVTRRAAPHFLQELNADLHWCAAIFGCVPTGPFVLTKGIVEIVQSNRVVTVPKNAKTTRTIAAEPTGNAFLQKAVGAVLRRRLRSHGVDLDDQSVNQMMARNCYSFRYATVDLSMASDTVAKELVYDLLPTDWAIFLDDLRSPSGKRGREIFEYEKFSSMGNAFTFELESLIFISLARAVGSELGNSHCPSFVYGDDIVIPQENWPLLKKVLEHVGFLPNQEKTHAAGTFFESCGKHYWEGVDVTPVYQKEVPTDCFGWIRAGNRLIRSIDRFPFVENAWRACRRNGGMHHLAIPIGVDGDDAWVLPRHEFRPVQSDRNRGFKCRVVRFLPKRERVDESSFYAYQLRKSFATAGDPLDHLVEGDGNLPFDGYVTRDLSKERYVISYRWVFPSWAETPRLR